MGKSANFVTWSYFRNGNAQNSFPLIWRAIHRKNPEKECWYNSSIIVEPVHMKVFPFIWLEKPPSTTSENGFIDAIRFFIETPEGPQLKGVWWWKKTNDPILDLGHVFGVTENLPNPIIQINQSPGSICGHMKQPVEVIVFDAQPRTTRGIDDPSCN